MQSLLPRQTSVRKNALQPLFLGIDNSACFERNKGLTFFPATEVAKRQLLRPMNWCPAHTPAKLIRDIGF